MNARDATPDDAEAVAAIYNHYILNTVITFEEVVLSGEGVLERITGYAQRYPWLVLEDGDAVRGYAYARAWHERPAYRHSAEVSIFLAHDHTGRGGGSLLYRELLDRLPALGVHAVMGGVALPNPASVALHEKFGFEKVAHYRQVGRKFGRWIDVGYWQLLFPPSDAASGGAPS